MQRKTDRVQTRRQFVARSVAGVYALATLIAVGFGYRRLRTGGDPALPATTAEAAQPATASSVAGAPVIPVIGQPVPTATGIAATAVPGTGMPVGTTPSRTSSISGTTTAISNRVTMIPNEPLPSGAVGITVDRSQPIGTSLFTVGVTLTESSFSPLRTDQAATSAKQLLQRAVRYQNQHIMAWGVGDPWPDPNQPGPTEWTELDQRLNLIRETQGTPVITLAEAPWWMKGLRQDQEWSPAAYERRVRDDMLDKWVLLCREVARRYTAAPHNVRHFQVWNELKGYYNPSTNKYDGGSAAGFAGEFAHGYTYMYNRVYEALKSVDPTIQVGGPYVVIDSWSDRAKMSHPSDVSGPYGTLDQRPLDVIKAWVKEKRGADFITIAGSTTNDIPSGGSQRDENRSNAYFATTQYFADVRKWVRQQTDLPLWWGEWRAFDKPGNNQDFANAAMACSLVQMVQSGTSTALLWAPEGDSNGWSFPLGLWTATNNPEGGKPTPYFATQQSFHEHFGAGVELFRVTSTYSGIVTLASRQKLLLINTVSQPVDLLVNRQPLQLRAYDVRLIDVP